MSAAVQAIKIATLRTAAQSLGMYDGEEGLLALRGDAEARGYLIRLLRCAIITLESLRNG